MLALAVCVMNRWLPLEYFYASLQSNILDIPSFPGYPLMISECRYDRWEAKYFMRLDPRRVEGSDCSGIESWIQTVRANVANYYNSLVGYDPEGLGVYFVQGMKEKCKDMSLRYYSILSLQNRVDLDSRLHDLMKAAPFSSVPAAYARVLQLLREADASGLWPESSHSRAQYIANNGIEKKDKSGKVLVDPAPTSQGGVSGGSFSIGCYPKPLLEPKGNTLFPGTFLLYTSI